MPCNAPTTYLSKNIFVRNYFWLRLKEMTRIIEPIDGSLILDVGCGRRELLGLIARKFPRSECVGIDVARDVGGTERTPNEHFLRADCLNLPFRAECAQSVLCASMLEHLPSVEPAVSEMARTLSQGGSLIVGAPTENCLYRFARRLTRLPKPLDHFHRINYIEKALNERLAHWDAQKPRKLPISFLPGCLSLYCIISFRKSRLL